MHKGLLSLLLFCPLISSSFSIKDTLLRIGGKRIELQHKVAIISIIEPINFEDTAKKLIQVAKNQDIAGLLIVIHSGGGNISDFTVLHDLIKKISSQKPVISLVSEALSAGYLLASATNYIIAHNMSAIGCIGVIWEYTEKTDEKREILTKGTYKQIGSTFPSQLDKTQLDYLDTALEKYYHLFISLIASNRNLNTETHFEWADAKVFIGSEAVEVGLIDEIGTYFEAEEKLIQLIQEFNPDVDCNKITSIEV